MSYKVFALYTWFASKVSFNKASVAENISFPSKLIEIPLTPAARVFLDTSIGEVTFKEVASLIKTLNKVTVDASTSAAYLVTVFPVMLMLPIGVGKPCASLPFSAAIKTFPSITSKVLSLIAMSSDAFWILITGKPFQSIDPSLKKPQFTKVLLAINEPAVEAPPK